MSEEKYKVRAKKLLGIALDMHQAKELRIQAVRVLKVMGAVDELWIVVQNVKCPFTRQSAIDCIPALESKVQIEEISDQASVPEDRDGKEERDAPEPMIMPDVVEYDKIDYENSSLTKDKIKKEPSQYGLTKIEAEIYTTLLKNGAKTLSEIVNITNLDRKETYHLLSSLQNKGVVNATFTHPIKYLAVSKFSLS